MKKQVRILGIDDGPFSFNQDKTIVVGIIMRGNGYMEGVIKDVIDIDGNDGTSVLTNMINSTKHHNQIRTVMIDGVAVGGFNVIDIDYLYKYTKIPIITVTRDKPNYESMKLALKNKFMDWNKRWDIIKRHTPHEIKTQYNPIYVTNVGIDEKETEEIIKMSTIRGVIPEPIRVAHMVASGIVRGESYGKA